MVGKPRDLQNAANYPDPSQSDREREAFVAGSQAWLDTNPDEQARAKFAALEHASYEARKENYKFSALVYKYRMHDPEREKQEERDLNAALIMQEPVSKSDPSSRHRGHFQRYRKSRCPIGHGQSNSNAPGNGEDRRSTHTHGFFFRLCGTR